MQKVPRRIVICRVIAVLLAAWSALLALDGPTITSSASSRPDSYECPAPLSRALPEDLRDHLFDPGRVPDWVASECRNRAIGTGVAIGFFGNVVALLLGLTRLPALPVEPPPSYPPVKPTWPPAGGAEESVDENALWNPGLHRDRRRDSRPTDGDDG